MNVLGGYKLQYEEVELTNSIRVLGTSSRESVGNIGRQIVERASYIASVILSVGSAGAGYSFANHRYMFAALLAVLTLNAFKYALGFVVEEQEPQELKKVRGKK